VFQLESIHAKCFENVFVFRIFKKKVNNATIGCDDGCSTIVVSLQLQPIISLGQKLGVADPQVNPSQKNIFLSFCGIIKLIKFSNKTVRGN
jgi:hypothetical protein